MKAIITCYFFSIFMLFPFIGKSQLFTISGIVTHQKIGNALEGVNIFETISKIGTITDKNGNFQLMLKTGDINISITLDGFKDFNKNLVLLNDTILNVQLEPKLTLKERQKSDEQVQIPEIAENDYKRDRRTR